MKRRVVALGLAAVMLPGLAGCWSGPDAATTTQPASGDGTQVDSADITLDSATIVAGDPGSGKAAFLGTVYNPTHEPDQVLSITADGVRAKLTPEAIDVRPLGAVAIQTGKESTPSEPAAAADFLGFQGKTGTYVDVEVTFRTAGEQSFTALVVPPSGFYATAAPEGTLPIPEKVNVEVTERLPAGEGAAAEETGARPVPSPTAS